MSFFINFFFIFRGGFKLLTTTPRLLNIIYIYIYIRVFRFQGKGID